MDVLPEALRPAEVSKLLRVSAATLRVWDRNGALPASLRSPGERRRYTRDDVLAFLGRRRETVRERSAAIYARVSTAKRAEAGNLEGQRVRLMEYAAVKGYRAEGSPCGQEGGDYSTQAIRVRQAPRLRREARVQRPARRASTSAAR